MIHDVIITANLFPYILLHSCLSVLEIIELNKSDAERQIEWIHSAAIYEKYLKRLGEMKIFKILQIIALVYKLALCCGVSGFTLR